MGNEDTATRSRRGAAESHESRRATFDPSPTTRRGVLAALSSTPLLAGCLSTPTGPAPTETSTPTESPGTPRPEWEGLPACPERPEPLTGETVGPFAEAFERAYLPRATMLGDDDVASVRFDFGLRVESVSADGGGFDVVLGGGYAIFYEPGGTTTATLHGDVLDYTARYYVDERTVHRVAGYSEAGDAREEGRRVRCPPREPVDDV